MFCSYSMVPRWVTWCPPAIRHRSLPLGTKSSRRRSGKSYVRRWLLPRSRNRDSCQHVRVSFCHLFHPRLSACFRIFKSSSFYHLHLISLRVRHRAISYYKRAADLGDKRAAQRLKAPNQPIHQPGGPGAVLHRDADSISGSGSAGKGKDGKECIIM